MVAPTTPPIEEKEEEEEEKIKDFIPEGKVEVLNKDRVNDSYILINNSGTNRVYLIDKEARLLHEWKLTNNIGNDVFLLPNGKLLASLEADEPKIRLGGMGGQLQFVAPDGTVEWKFDYSSPERETHHDAELLPNGNVIAMVWEKHSVEEAIEAGFVLEEEVYVESIIEVNPTTQEIVWEWSSWDHLIQELDNTKSNYGSISEHPERIDFNYVPISEGSTATKGDIMHANGIAYDEVNDVILLSVNFYSEVWVIDHSTSTAEAATSSGGNYDKGGDLIYRFGNPEAYQNNFGQRLFYNNHFPNILKGEHQGKLLIFSNGNDKEQSTVFEMYLPEEFNLRAKTNNELKISWSFTDPNLYSSRVSGAVPLPNGNIMITEGDYGIWEVTQEKEVVWKFSADGSFWRAYHYDKDAPGILALGLE
ncbi:MAG: aryl-sulfate sulfotransferase [Flavobacteriaceae bacterium]